MTGRHSAIGSQISSATSITRSEARPNRFVRRADLTQTHAHNVIEAAVAVAEVKHGADHPT
jgi:hypothetical protein